MIKEITEQSEWDIHVLNHDGHPLQLWGWGDVKASHGWKVKRYQLANEPWTGAQVLLRPLPWPLKYFAYIPRGPVGKWTNEQLDALTEVVKESTGAVTVCIEPDTTQHDLSKRWRKTKNTVLVPSTMQIDLENSIDALLGAMTKKTRQYIRKSENTGVTVRRADATDIDRCLEIYRLTAKRARFQLHPKEYYLDIFNKMKQHSPVLVAEYEGTIEAFLWLASSKSTAFELYGGVSDRGQELRANYILKWQAMLLMKEEGVKMYDLNGLLNDGISTFKRGFASSEVELVGTFERPLSVMYPVWSWGLPAAKRVVRLIKR